MVPQNSRKLTTDVADPRHPYTAILVLAALLPAILAFGLLYKERISVPYQDDYAVILEFASGYQRLPSLEAKLIRVATTQNNDYKLVFVHLLTAAQLEIAGHLDFAALVVFGNLLLLPIAYLLWLTYRTGHGSMNDQLLEFLPISLLFFSLTYWETLNWAAPALQNLSVILFSFLAIYFLSSRVPLSRTLLLAGCASGILSAFSSANGFLVAPIGMLMLVRRRAIADSLVWCFSFLLPIGAYLYHYVPYHVSFERMHTTSYIVKVGYLFAFMGCAIPSRWPAALMGIAIFAVFGLAVYFRFEQTKPVTFYFTLWILATAVLVGWLRGTIESRYSIYSILLIIFCYSFINHLLATRMKDVGRKRFYTTCILLTVGVLIVADYSAHNHLSMRRGMILSGLDHYKRNPGRNSPTIDPKVAEYKPDEPEFERAVLTTAIEQRIYSLPK